MLRVKEILLMRFLSERSHTGLAVLRVCTGMTLFLRHGLQKQPAHWAQFMAHFPDPIGIGPHVSFFIAFFSDFVCGILLIIGLGPRWAALYCFGNIFVAWALVHHFAFLGKGPGSDHGELIVLYMGALLTLLLAGPGAPSLDRLLARKPWFTSRNARTALAQRFRQCYQCVYQHLALIINYSTCWESIFRNGKGGYPPIELVVFIGHLKHKNAPVGRNVQKGTDRLTLA
jgi:putative oxidoreductase